MHESIGQLVTSRAGRDRGRPYLVVGVLDDRFVLVADGDLRPVDRPKRKNMRHLVFHRAWAQEIRQQLAAGKRPGNADLRRALAALVAEHFGKERGTDEKPEVQGG
ncbi:LSU ribosomal protein L14E [Thermaerobacter marianensis DSM 12885]|uniref:LSU ribosomal protein L14E n=1 Tax=Thermaerobacter marianensis (strain ATCC 700841 / DSM 12885 / JCM 10246 / 7p75a) TaxID=644966 RepID=E6SKX8_THEM7|nr:KOW domain-containing RNA-binding protein [Thermaerobacter marianensis]ADU52351.1 LSU ribosomal protein L14E [Thermaerobacter marianensis DSM 12885]